MRVSETLEVGDLEQMKKLIGRPANVPVFLYFHLLCPRQQRRSVVVLTGGMEAMWGDKDLAAKLNK
jgi:hypothetical protein